METEELKIALADDVLASFKKAEPRVVGYKGMNFKVGQMPTTAFFSGPILALPFISSALEGWKDKTKQEQEEISASWAERPEYLAAVHRVAVLTGVLEPKFSDRTPCPVGCVPIDGVEEGLVDFLGTVILLRSGFDKGSREFFRGSPQGEAAGA